MDQKKNGSFIASVRKERGLTQKEIAMMLELSDKTISKWECGNGMPEMVYVLPLCKILSITAGELLSGEYISEIRYKEKAEETLLKMAEDIEFQQLKHRVLKQYGKDIVKIARSGLGAGSLTYFITESHGEEYVLKYPTENSCNHPELEIDLCDHLSQHGIKVCEFVQNLQGSKISIDENGRLYTLQKKFHGTCYAYHEAPDWLLPRSSSMLANIHKVLKDYKTLPTGIGKDFFRYMTPETALNSCQHSIQIARNNEDTEIEEDLSYRIELMKRLNKPEFELSKLTCLNTHGDYMISQTLCGEDDIVAVIDWTTACVHPVVWEIMRSYLYASRKCKDGEIDVVEWQEYVKTYLEIMPLTEYDLKIMPQLFFYQIAVCDYYGQYYASITSNRSIYLEQATFSTQLLRLWKRIWNCFSYNLKYFCEVR